MMDKVFKSYCTPELNEELDQQEELKMEDLLEFISICNENYFKYVVKTMKSVAANADKFLLKLNSTNTGGLS